MFKLSKIIKSFAYILAVVIMSISLSYVVMAVWQEPTLSPPDGNKEAPVNASADDQTKGGSLSLNLSGVSPMGLFVNRNAYFMNGNVGIGTAGPLIKLAIGDTDTGLDWTGDGQLDIMSNNIRSISARDGNVGIGTNGPSIKLAIGDTDTGLNWTGDGLLDIYSNNENTISVRNDRVGIRTGAANPLATLDVNGNLRVAGAMESYTQGASASATAWSSGSTNTDIWRWYVNGTDNWAGIGTRTLQLWGYPYDSANGCCHRLLTFNLLNNNAWFDGNVGIGTDPVIKFAVGDTDTGLNWAGDGQLDIYSNNVNTMSVRSGDVGIGTAIPQAKLDVVDGLAIVPEAVEEYSNHLGTVDNFMQTGTAGGASVSSDAANHQMNIRGGVSWSGAYFATKKTFTLSSKPIVVNFLINNLDLGVGGDQYIEFGLKEVAGLNQNSFGNSAMIAYDAKNYSGSLWRTNTGTGALTDVNIAAFSSGDLATIVATSSVVSFYKNGTLIARHTTNIPTVPLKIVANAGSNGADTTTQASIGVDMISMKAYR